MNEQIESITEAPAPKQAKRKKVVKRAKRKIGTEAKPIAGGEYAGISAHQCCTNCTAERCVITTIALCGHPYKASLHNAGPKTKARIIEVRKLLKHQMIDAEKL